MTWIWIAATIIALIPLVFLSIIGWYAIRALTGADDPKEKP